MATQTIQFSLSELQTCSGCKAWAESMFGQNFHSLEGAVVEAKRIWWQQVPVTGWLEAIQAHPRLGDIKAVESKQRGSATCFQRETAAEQDNLLAESHDFILMMQELNKSYEDKFGHVFLLFAKGKSPTQVMQCIQERLHNSPVTELKVAAQQEINIIEDRLRTCMKTRSCSRAQSDAEQRTGVLLRHLNPGAHGVDLLHADVTPRQQVTCHVLDTARGCPATGLPVVLLRHEEGSRPCDSLWRKLNTMKTNSDGRAEGLSAGVSMSPGMYRVAFDTAQYYESTGLSYAFYPQPVIDFMVTQQTVGEHFHIPLLISPFSYSTYRGS